MWEQLKRIIKPNGAIVLFGSEPFSSMLRVSNLKLFKYDWIWEKQKPSNFQLMNYQVGKVHEIISVFSKYSSSYVKNGKIMKYYPIYDGNNYNRKTKIYNNNVENTTLRDNGLKEKLSIETHKEYKGKLPRSVLRYNVDISNKLHPTQKPVDLLEYLIKTYSLENETVLDFTAGSFSTGVACVNTNRKFIGIELDKNYFDIGSKRVLDRVEEIKKEDKLLNLME